MKQIIFATTSPRRKELFEKTGIPFTMEASSYEENMNFPYDPIGLAKELSLGKAKAVADNHINEDCIVIGADTFIYFKEKVLGKPHTQEVAIEMLKELSGQMHLVITGFTIIDILGEKVLSEAVQSRVFFKNFSEPEIIEYVETGEPLDKAGAYAIQGIGAKLIDRIEGDYSNIVGLPVDDLLRALETFGIVRG